MRCTLTPGARRILGVAALAAVAACQERNAPLSPAPPHPSTTISDGAHNGNDDAFFLPPLVGDPSKSPGYGDPFQPGLPVRFMICSVATSTDDCQSAGSQVVRTLLATASLTDESYQAQWDTKSDNLDPTRTYRIEVWIEDFRLAFADVDVVSSGSELHNVNTNDYIALLDGRTLPIRVRIERGWRCVNDASCVSQVVTTTPPPGQTATIVVASDSQSAAAFPADWFDTSQVHTDQVVVTIEDVTTQLRLLDPATGCGIGQTVMLTDGHCVRFTTDPKVTFTAPVRVQVCVENPGDLRQMLLKYDYNEPPEFLANVPQLYPCPEPQVGSTGGTGTFDRLASALSRAGGALWRLVGPRTAYAIHLGVGGQISVGGGFSLIAPALPAEMIAVDGNGQTGAVGAALPIAPTVQLLTLHPAAAALAGDTVTCSITSGGGSFGGAPSAVVVSNADGMATCPAWTLGASPGTNTVLVTAAHVDAIIRANRAPSDGESLADTLYHGSAQFLATGVNGGPFIASLTLAGTSVVYNGVGTTNTATFTNPMDGTFTNLLEQGWIVQGTARRGAGGTMLECTEFPGELPTGDCTMSFSVNVGSNSGGSGTLVTGPAVYELDLQDASGKIYDSKTVAITLTVP